MLAQRCADESIPTVSSLAGRVRDPALPAGEVRIGGFGGVDGLVDWLRAARPEAIIDATHPFAQAISRHAAAAAEVTGIPLCALVRPEWTPGPGDDWQLVDTVDDAARRIADHAVDRVFITTGRRDLAAFAHLAAWCLIRVVDPPAPPLPARHQLITDRGPYELDAERTLLRDNGIEMLVTKNSGGAHTRPKLDAAAELGLPVVMVRRPLLPTGVTTVETVEAALAWLRGVEAHGR